MHILDPEARILEYVDDIFGHLDGIGYYTFRDHNPGKTLKLIQEMIYPIHLKYAMREHLQYQEGLKKEVNKFVELFRKEEVIQKIS